MGEGYEFPDLSDPVFVTVQVLTDENDRPVQALIAKQTVEMYLLMDKRWGSPRWRWEAFKQLHRLTRVMLRSLGYDTVHAWLPPQIEKSFGVRKLMRIGWKKALWPCFFRSTLESE